MSIRAHAARLDLGARVTLYDLDLTSLGGGIERFTPMANVLGSFGYERLTSPGKTDIRRHFPVHANTSRAWYVRLVIRKETANSWFSWLGFTSNGQQSAVAFDPNASKNLTGVQRANNAIGSIQLVQYVAQGNHVIIGASIITTTSTRIDGVFLAPNGGSWASTTWGSNSAIVPGAKLDVVSLELWEETTLNNLQKFSDGFDHEDEAGLISTVTPTDEVVAPLRWRGNDYAALPIEAEGFEVSGKGPYARPRIRISNALGLGTAMNKQFNDLLGAKVTRWRTFSRYLDQGVTPDPNAHLPVDIYYVDMKSRQNKAEVEWELASILDQQGMMLPGRQVLKHGCQLQYRVWDGSTFRYDNVSCPYVGSQYFDETDTPVTGPASDRCSQQLSGCLKRFPGTRVPFGGFPMVGRITR